MFFYGFSGLSVGMIVNGVKKTRLWRFGGGDHGRVCMGWTCGESSAANVFGFVQTKEVTQRL
jgi:hypothetical protein